MLVLASGAGELIGVDLDSGAFVRAGTTAHFRPFDVVAAPLAEGEALWSPHAPEAVELAQPPTPVGRLSGRRAERYLRPLLDRRTKHLLGFAGPAAPFWTLTGDRPSLALVVPEAGPAVVGNRHGFRCRFAWRGVDHDLPLWDARVVAALERRERWRCTPDGLRDVLGRRPTHVLVALTPPHHGHCYKVAAALLPRP